MLNWYTKAKKKNHFKLIWFTHHPKMTARLSEFILGPLFSLVRVCVYTNVYELLTQ